MNKELTFAELSLYNNIKRVFETSSSCIFYKHIEQDVDVANVIKHLAEIYSEINFVELNHDDIETKIEFYKERNYDKRD